MARHKGEFGGIAELEQEPPINWLIPGVLPANELTMLYGREGTFKSFIALGWSLMLARAGSPVMYIAAEGLSGIRPRVAAWRAHHMGDPEATVRHWHYFNSNVYLNEEAENWSDYLGEYMMAAYRAVPVIPRIKLIVVDTLDRNYSGEENSSKEMGHFLDGLEYLRHKYGAAIMVIHHMRKEGDRERGITSLPAAMFASYRVTDVKARPSRGGASVLLECVKMKDGRAPAPVRAEFVPITLATDEYGDPYDHSLALDQLVEAPSEKKPPLIEATPGEGEIIDLARLNGGEITGPKLAELMGISAKEANRRLYALVKEKRLKKDLSNGVHTVI